MRLFYRYNLEMVRQLKILLLHSFADHRTLDRMTALLGEIINAQSLMLQESRKYGEEAEPELYEGFIESALEHLEHLGKIRETPVEFFCKNTVPLCCI